MSNMFAHAHTFVHIAKSGAERDTATESDADYARRRTRHAEAMLEPRDLLAPIDANSAMERHAHFELTGVPLFGLRRMEHIA